MRLTPTNFFICLIGIASVSAGCAAKTYEEAGVSYIEYRLSDEEVRTLDPDAKIIYLGIVNGSISYGKTLSAGLIEAAKRSASQSKQSDGYVCWDISLEPGKTARERSRIAYVECYLRTKTIRAAGTATYIK